MTADAPERTSPSARAGGWHVAHQPLAVFAIAFGLARVPSLFGRPRRVDDLARLLGVGDGAETLLTGAAAAAGLLLTAAAVLAIARRRDVWLLAALAGWAAGLAALTAVAAAAGDPRGLAGHGVFFALFAGQLLVAYRYGARARSASGPAGTAPDDDRAAGPADTRRDIDLRPAESTHRDIEPRSAESTRRDIGPSPAGRDAEPRPADATRRDIAAAADDAADDTAAATGTDAPAAADGTRRDIPIRPGTGDGEADPDETPDGRAPDRGTRFPPAGD